MGLRLRLALLVALLSVLVYPGTGDHDTTKQLSYSETLNVFKDIVNPYEEKKSSRNKETDKQVENIISQIMRVLPETTALHGNIQKLTDGAKVLKPRISDPLAEVKKSLTLTVQDLNTCSQARVHISSPALDSSSESDEEGTEDVVDPKYKHESRRRSILDRQTFSGLITPLADSLSERLNDTLEAYSENTFIPLRDAARAFRAMAEIIANEHASRFYSLVPKVAAVTDTIQSIMYHVTNAKEESADLCDLAHNYVKSSLICVQELVNLTTTVKDLAGGIC